MNGDVFILTKGLESIKLGQVRVSFVHEREMSKSADAKIAAVKREAAANAAEIQKATAELHAAQDAGRDATKRWLSAQNRYLAMRKSAKLAFFDRVLRPAMEKRDQTHELVERKMRAVAELQATARLLASGAVLFRDLPNAVASATTDADGKFSVKLSPGKYAAVARASRSAAVQDTEGQEYYWFVWVTVNDEAEQRLMLSNDNQLGTACSGCIFVFTPSDFLGDPATASSRL